jgi:hypothetical protein
VSSASLTPTPPQGIRCAARCTDDHNDQEEGKNNAQRYGEQNNSDQIKRSEAEQRIHVVECRNHVFLFLLAGDAAGLVEDYPQPSFTASGFLSSPGIPRTFFTTNVISEMAILLITDSRAVYWTLVQWGKVRISKWQAQIRVSDRVGLGIADDTRPTWDWALGFRWQTSSHAFNLANSVFEFFYSFSGFSRAPLSTAN